MKIKKRGVSAVLIRNSKSQAAIFIIFALIVILSGLLYFFYQKQAAEKLVEVVKPEIVPVKLYVENCIKSVADDGLEKIGLSGGYIKMPEIIGKNPSAYLSTFPGSDFKIPFWWHDGIDAVPREDFIRQQLESHIKSELKSCINNFAPFAVTFEINQLKEPDVKVQFNDNDVSVDVGYPLEVVSKEGKLKQLIQKFGYTSNIRFKKVYELAKLIMDRENVDSFIEVRTIDLYSMDRNIPTTDVEAACSPKSWRLSNIKDRLRTLLRVNIPYIKIKGTNYNPKIYVPNPSGESTYAGSYYQQHYVWEVDTNPAKYRNMKVSFAYEDWPLQIYARPSQNGILRSNVQKGTEALSFLCLQIWHFTYDIKYPVLVTVSDPETDASKDYHFTFAFRANIDHNQPNRLNTGTTAFEANDEPSSQDYCNAVQNEITLFTVNNATGDDLKDVNLTFACGRFYCDMGQSSWLSLGAAAGITKRFPYCLNGVIKATKQGFADSKSFMQTDADGRSYVLSLNPIKQFRNYKVVKHLLSNPGAAQELAPDEKASILIRGKNPGYESFAVYPKEADSILTIADGRDATYEVTVYLVNNETILGGYMGDWTVSKNALTGSNEVVFHVVEQGHTTDDDRFLFISGLSDYSKNIPQPELK